MVRSCEIPKESRQNAVLPSRLIDHMFLFNPAFQWHLITCSTGFRFAKFAHPERTSLSVLISKWRGHASPAFAVPLHLFTFQNSRKKICWYGRPPAHDLDRLLSCDCEGLYTKRFRRTWHWEVKTPKTVVWPKHTLQLCVNPQSCNISLVQRISLIMM